MWESERVKVIFYDCVSLRGEGVKGTVPKRAMGWCRVCEWWDVEC